MLCQQILAAFLGKMLVGAAVKPEAARPGS
jgi:hypothetical protein